MRMAVVWLLALCACESRYGDYFNVDGDSNGIRFDHVELYFGKHGMSDSNIGKPSGSTTGDVFIRDADASDAWDVDKNGDGSLASESTYWLPITEQNRELAYVAALAYDTTMQSDKPVGVGEVLGFALEDGIVNKYDIELQKFDFTVDTWGQSPGCFAWTRQRDGKFSTIAVLSPDDADCDGVVASADCNDLCPAGSTKCNPDETVCGGANSCGLGCAINGLCRIETCLPTIACTNCGMFAASLDDRMKCVSSDPAHHLSVLVDTLGGKPCARSFDVPNYGRPCSGVTEVWQQNFGDGWDLTVSPSANDLTHCIVELTNTSTSATFAGDHHVLVAFPPRAPSSSQWSVLLGVKDVPATACQIDGGYTIDGNVGAPNDCL
ncbi:MAG TPA: hypothetical protein VMZ53_27815 [Kofleriaceae bacterium]|nr:hypothetical protein [Kofleriaceae bacterium]